VAWIVIIEAELSRNAPQLDFQISQIVTDEKRRKEFARGGFTSGATAMESARMN
jgi:hypothetical protein